MVFLMVNGEFTLLGGFEMRVEPAIPSPFKHNVSFGILKEVKQRAYGEYMWGMYKGKKIEVFDAYKENQFLIYVSENMNFLKSKLKYFQDGVMKVLRSEGRHLNELV